MLNALLILVSSVVSFQAAPPKANPEARTVEIVGADNMKYSVTRIEAKPGETLRIVLTTVSKMSKEMMAHNVVVLRKGANASKLNAAAASARATNFIPLPYRSDILAYTGLAAGGETVEVTFTVPNEAGSYEYICTFPGHFTLGMKGVLVVK